MKHSVSVEGMKPKGAQAARKSGVQQCSEEANTLRQAAEGLDAAGDAVADVAKTDRAKAEAALAEELAVLAEEARDVESRVLAAARRLEDVPEPKEGDSVSSRLTEAIKALRGQK